RARREPRGRGAASVRGQELRRRAGAGGRRPPRGGDRRAGRARPDQPQDRLLRLLPGEPLLPAQVVDGRPGKLRGRDRAEPHLSHPRAAHQERDRRAVEQQDRRQGAEDPPARRGRAGGAVPAGRGEGGRLERGARARHLAAAHARTAVMPVYQLDHRLWFPPPEAAEDGLLAVGGDLRPERLLLAYSRGIFPWYEEGIPILWHSPDPRLVLPAASLHVSRSLRKTLKRHIYDIRFDTAFAQVIAECARVKRPGQRGTWITRDMRAAYLRLHESGFAHST